jgi:putative hydrolase of the HAD superfamily
LKRKYSVIVSDLGNVLIPFDYGIVIKRLNQIESGLGDNFYAYYKQHYELHRKFERGEIPENEFISKLLKVVQNKVDNETICRFYSEIFTVNDKVVELLPLLKKNYRLVLLSNTNSIHMRYGWGDYKFLSNFEKLILSHEVKAVKPEEAIYRAVEKYTGLPSEEHIFIDDIPEYIEGAKKCGWDGIVFSNYQQLWNDLKNRGIIF